MRTVCGRPDLADHVPTQDAEAVARLRRSGAIIVGKTNMPTGNADVQASNPVFGRTNNPWDRSRTSGGSAGGGAAATAAGLTSFDYGSEIGGSTRIPAHFCGLYGHKSTWQSVPLAGHIPGGPGNPGRWGEADMACAGVQARGARDIIPALEATVGPLNPDGGFSYTLAPPRATALKDFRVAVWADDPDCPIDKDVRRAIDDAVTALRDAGARVVEQPASIPVDIDYLTRTLPEPGDGRLLGRPVHDQPTLRRRPCPALAQASPWRRRRRTAGNDPKPPRVVVPRRGSSGDRAALGRVLQRVRRAAAARSHPPLRPVTTTRTMTASAAPSTSTVSPAPTGTKPNGARWPTSPERRPRRCPSPPMPRAYPSASRRWDRQGETAPPWSSPPCSPRFLAATASRRNTAHPSASTA